MQAESDLSFPISNKLPSDTYAANSKLRASQSWAEVAALSADNCGVVGDYGLIEESGNLSHSLPCFPRPHLCPVSAIKLGEWL